MQSGEPVVVRVKAAEENPTAPIELTIEPGWSPTAGTCHYATAKHYNSETESVLVERGYPDDCRVAPEPSEGLLLTAGLLLLVYIGRRRGGRPRVG